MENRRLKRQREIAAKLSRPRPVELPSGSWRCQIMVRGERFDVIEDDPETAHARALAIKAGILDKREKTTGAETISLSKAIELYVSAREGVLSPATVRGYETIRKNRLKKLMGMDVHKITLEDVQIAISEDASEVSAKTVANTYGLIKTVLKKYGLDISSVKLPQKKKVEKKYMQPQDVGALIDAVKGDDCETEILLAVWLGLRRSEIMGLCWDCVDFESKKVKIMRVVVPDKKNKWVLKDIPKNVSSQRDVPCPDYIMEKIKQMYSPGKSGQLFKCHPDTLLKHIHRACKKAGITDTTTHGLRHTNAAVMKTLGVDDAHAMERGGWSSESTYKKTYAYVFEQEAKAADKKIDAYFEKLHTDLHKNK